MYHAFKNEIILDYDLKKYALITPDTVDFFFFVEETMR